MGDVATAGVFLKPSSDVRCFALKDLVFELEVVCAAFARPDPVPFVY